MSKTTNRPTVDNNISNVDPLKMGMYGEMPIVTIGDMELSMFTNQENEKEIWMQKVDGEGMQVRDQKSLGELSKLLEDWFNKNF